MSARASAYAKTLIVCPNGERISRGEKLVLISLADSHQDKGKHFTYPSIETIAEDALCDRRSCQRHLAALERKGVIKRLRPERQGSGMTVFYFFTALDSIPDGWQNAALFDGIFSLQKGGKRAAEGRQKGDKSCTPSITNTNSNEELKASPPNPLASEGESTGEFAPADVCLDAEQLAHLERCPPEDRAMWERAYREGNAAKAAARKAEADQEAQARAEYPTRAAAIQRVMSLCGFQRGVRKRCPIAEVLGQVIDAEAARGQPVWRTGPRLAAAWEVQRNAKGERIVKYGPLKFYRDGHWRDWAEGR